MRGEVPILVYCPIDTLQWGSTHSAMVHSFNQEMPIESMISLVSPQMAYLNRCIIALVALICIFLHDEF